MAALRRYEADLWLQEVAYHHKITPLTIERTQVIFRDAGKHGPVLRFMLSLNALMAREVVEMTSSVLQAKQSLGENALWKCNLADGLLRPENIDVAVPKNGRDDLASVGLPPVSLLRCSEQLVSGHPLEEFIRKSECFGRDDIERLLRHPAIDLSIVGFHSGSITASVAQGLEFDRNESQDYSRNMWARDSIIVASALHRAGFADKAHQVIQNLWSFAGSPEQRGKILQFHWGPVDERRRLFIEGNNGPHIKYSVGENGQLLLCDHDWGHQQLDALGAMVWAPYRFANQRQRMGGDAWGTGVLDLRALDPIPSASDSILPATIKMFYGAEVHDTLDYGPWEDIREWRRATSVGIVVAALREARIFHEREGWSCLPVEYHGRQDGGLFREQLEETLSRCEATLRDRIPDFGHAVESDRRPVDSALVFLLFPFDARLSSNQQDTIVRTVYKNIGEAGIRRWDRDIFAGPDHYVGQDFFYNGDPADKGEFSKVTDGFRPAQWSLFDPLLAAYFYRRFVDSAGRDTEAFVYGDRHLKRTLSFITPSEHELHVVGKGRTFRIPAGILPEAYAWDSARQEWRPNHNSPLLMAQAALGLAFERALEACRLAQGVQIPTGVGQ